MTRLQEINCELLSKAILLKNKFYKYNCKLENLPCPLIKFCKAQIYKVITSKLETLVVVCTTGIKIRINKADGFRFRNYNSSTIMFLSDIRAVMN